MLAIRACSINQAKMLLAAGANPLAVCSVAGSSSSAGEQAGEGWSTPLHAAGESIHIQLTSLSAFCICCESSCDTSLTVTVAWCNPCGGFALLQLLCRRSVEGQSCSSLTQKKSPAAPLLTVIICCAGHILSCS
jgi:hypothetical protein